MSNLILSWCISRGVREDERMCSQCGLSGTVGSYNGDSRLQTNVEVNILQNQLVRRITEGDFRCLQERRRQLVCLWESIEGSNQLVWYECAVDATDLKVSVSSISGGVNSGS